MNTHQTQSSVGSTDGSAVVHRYVCPRCGHHKSWVFKSKHYGLHARKCKACGLTRNGGEFTEQARKLLTPNQIVNECGCDSNNLPTKVTPVRWGDGEYESIGECEQAIAEYLVAELDARSGHGVVTHGDKSYLIKINATLIE